uniref:Uncharacterized protein n=1 Tax=Acrobeloides nanus TaxID=290746 RepID=A0A914EN59_9BILA
MKSEEALRFVEDELENEDVLQADIALVLPEDGSDTDEDNTDEDLGGDFIKTTFNGIYEPKYSKGLL